jgi:hypothetical protein
MHALLELHEALGNTSQINNGGVNNIPSLQKKRNNYNAPKE